MPKEEKIRNTTSFEHNGDKYILQYPTGSEILACENIKSKVWFECVKIGVRTEEEIYFDIENQGRFNREEHDKKIREIDDEIVENLLLMTSAKTKEDLEKYYDETTRLRKRMFSCDRVRQNLVEKSAEQKAENAYYLTLLAISLYKEEKNPIGKIKKVYPLAVMNDMGKINLEATYQKVQDSDCDEVLALAIQKFLPFIKLGTTEEIKFPEDIALESKMKEINELAAGETEVEEKTAEESETEHVKDIVEEPKQDEAISEIEGMMDNIYDALPERSILPFVKEGVGTEEDNNEEFYKKILKQQGGEVMRMDSGDGTVSESIKTRRD